ncbi:MAG: aminomethyl-transferring glycine dehydrogenase subunit GcvPA [Christensenellales bacterium]|jgi:glycine dehydrogenase subunit 1|nr:aminomethyl-transferring glycine dehydrogenase subunit GcvPA [Clostridiales bacterium]
MAKYYPHTESDIKQMLSVIGIDSVDSLYAGLEELKAEDIDLAEGMGQQGCERYIDKLSKQNKVYSSIFLGAGAYNHYIPAVVRNLAGREEFLTAYTPYQPEISQGILQTIFEYQTMICNLCGMDLSNASVYDGATALAEGLLMLAEKGKNKVLFSEGINPKYLEVVKTYLRAQNVEIEYVGLDGSGKTSIEELKRKLDQNTFAVALAQPNFYGVIEDAQAVGEIVKQRGANYIMSCNPISLALLKTPDECGADVATGEGQPLGMPLSFGGPYLGFIAAKQKYMRKMVGRIVGKTTDSKGKEAYVLTLQAREQHIRREKASSSICSNQAHCALMATLYMAAMGKKGMKEVASQCVSKAHYLAKKMTALEGFELKYGGEFFNEFVIRSKISSDKIIAACREKDILAGLKLGENEILWCVTETNSVEDMDKLIEVLKEAM